MHSAANTLSCVLLEDATARESLGVLLERYADQLAIPERPSRSALARYFANASISTRVPQAPAAGDGQHSELTR
jgi:hypothetical protein